jgi:hypothetical protein
MPLYTPSYTFLPGATITTAGLNACANDMATLLNVTKLNSSNIQAGGISLGNLAKPYQIYSVLLQAAEGGTGTTRALPHFLGYAQVLDSVTLFGAGTIIGVSAQAATAACAVGQKVRVSLYNGLSETTLAELDCVAAGVGSPPQTAVLSQAYNLFDSLRIRMTGTGSLANLPVNVTVFLKDYHRS